MSEKIRKFYVIVMILFYCFANYTAIDNYISIVLSALKSLLESAVLTALSSKHNKLLKR